MRASDDDEHPIDVAQRVILDELITSYPAHLSEPELALLVADELDTPDALLELRASGLVHEHCGFWWASRPAMRIAALGYARG